MKLEHSLSKWTGLECWARAWEPRKARDDEEGEAGRAGPAKVKKGGGCPNTLESAERERERDCHRFSLESGGVSQLGQLLKIKFVIFMIFIDIRYDI